MDIAKHTTDFGLDEDRSWLGSAHGTDATRSGTLDVSTLVSGTHFSAGGGLVKSGTAVGLVAGSGLWQPYSTVAGTNAAVKITVATSGNTTVGYQGDTAAATSIAADSGGAATLLGLLEGLPDIDPGDFTAVAGSGGDAGKIIVTPTLTGHWANRPLGTFTATGTGASATQTTAGVAGTFSALGVLFSSVAVTGTTAADAPIAILEQGFIVEALLPTNHGVDAAFKTACPLIHFR